jgi:hypothetical protein
MEHPKSQRFEDLTGQRFGQLTVVKYAGMLGNKRPYHSGWLCQCDCSAKVNVRADHLKRGLVQSCGCLKAKLRREELTGRRFDHWTVLGFGEVRDGKNYWLCRCDCLAKTERMVFGPSLVRGLSKSCGCHRSENSSKMMTQLRAEGRAWDPMKHGGAHWPEYGIWTKMKSRCLNPDDPAYPNYGGRGIGLHEPWKDFGVFIKDVGRRPSPRHSLDRIDNDGPYAPGNVRWATAKEQANNKRRLSHLEQFTEEEIRAELERRKVN